MRRIAVISIALLSLALAGTACSKNKPVSTGGSPTGAGSASGCTEANAVDLTADNPFTITVKNLAFSPDCFKAASASSITIVNNDGVDHTFTIDGTQVDAPLPAGQTFNGESPGLAPGTYAFHCKIHPAMTGTVIVV
jgi:plastocyanin